MVDDNVQARMNRYRLRGDENTALGLRLDAERDERFSEMQKAAIKAGRGREFVDAFSYLQKRSHNEGLAADRNDMFSLLEPFALSDHDYAREKLEIQREGTLGTAFTDDDVEALVRNSRRTPYGAVKTRIDRFVNHAALERHESGQASSRRVRVDITGDPSENHPLTQDSKGRFAKQTRFARPGLGLGMRRFANRLGFHVREQRLKTKEDQSLEDLKEKYGIEIRFGDGKKPKTLAQSIAREKDFKETRAHLVKELKNAKASSEKARLRDEIRGLEMAYYNNRTRNQQLREMRRGTTGRLASIAAAPTKATLGVFQGLTAAFKGASEKKQKVRELRAAIGKEQDAKKRKELRHELSLWEATNPFRLVPKKTLFLVAFFVLAMVLTLFQVLGFAALQAVSVLGTTGFNYLLWAANSLILLVWGLAELLVNLILGLVSGVLGFFYDAIYNSALHLIPGAAYAKPILAVSGTAFPQLAYWVSVMHVTIHTDGTKDYGLPTWVPVDVNGVPVQGTGSFANKWYWFSQTSQFSPPHAQTLLCDQDGHCQEGSVTDVIKGTVCAPLGTGSVSKFFGCT